MALTLAGAAAKHSLTVLKAAKGPRSEIQETGVDTRLSNCFPVRSHQKRVF